MKHKQGPGCCKWSPVACLKESNYGTLGNSCIFFKWNLCFSLGIPYLINVPFSWYGTDLIDNSVIYRVENHKSKSKNYLKDIEELPFLLEIVIVKIGRFISTSPDVRASRRYFHAQIKWGGIECWNKQGVLTFSCWQIDRGSKSKNISIQNYFWTKISISATTIITPLFIV